MNHSNPSSICNEYFYGNKDGFVTIFRSYFQFVFAHELYMFSLLLKDLYVNFRYLIMCKMGMSRYLNDNGNF